MKYNDITNNNFINFLKGGTILFKKMDRRPTLASWPKRIYDWSELPELFLCALSDWRTRGLLPGNVTYIPRVNQYASDDEYVTAWFGREAVLITAHDDHIESIPLHTRGNVDYKVQLLKCTIEAEILDGKHASFSYNKVKEEQLLPILNIMLCNAPDFIPRLHHPNGVLNTLQENSYAMYNTASLCYRFGDIILDSIWLYGHPLGRGKRRQRPEWFLAEMQRGLVLIATDFYGIRVKYLPWICLAFVEIKETARPHSHKLDTLVLTLGDKYGASFTVPLLDEQREEARMFANHIKVFSNS